MSLRRLPALAAIALFAVAAAGAAPARLYHNDAMRVKAFEPPPGWELAPQSSYPGVLAIYSERSGARITLTGRRVSPGTRARALAEKAQAALAQQGYLKLRVTDGDQWVYLNGVLDGGQRFVEQAYLVDGDLAYVVSLVAPRARSALMMRDFDEAVSSLVLIAATPPDGGLAR